MIIKYQQLKDTNFCLFYQIFFKIINRTQVRKLINWAIKCSTLHSLGGAFYALKAVKLANKNIEKERDWQVKKLSELPSEIIEIRLCGKGKN